MKYCNIFLTLVFLVVSGCGLLEDTTNLTETDNSSDTSSSDTLSSSGTLEDGLSSDILYIIHSSSSYSLEQTVSNATMLSSNSDKESVNSVLESSNEHVLSSVSLHIDPYVDPYAKFEVDQYPEFNMGIRSVVMYQDGVKKSTHTCDTNTNLIWSQTNQYNTFYTYNDRQLLVEKNQININRGGNNIYSTYEYYPNGRLKISRKRTIRDETMELYKMGKVVYDTIETNYSYKADTTISKSSLKEVCTYKDFDSQTNTLSYMASDCVSGYSMDSAKVMDSEGNVIELLIAPDLFINYFYKDGLLVEDHSSFGTIYWTYNSYGLVDSIDVPFAPEYSAGLKYYEEAILPDFEDPASY
jgi:hypothetical protein